MVSSIDIAELVAGAAVVVVAFWVPNYLSKRIKHGEARFDENGKLIKDD